jgi:hypothetical protein
MRQRTPLPAELKSKRQGQRACSIYNCSE